MDNLAHALVGAATGRLVGGSRVPRPALLGALAANAPDWAEVFVGWPWPRPLYLAEHRGITHAFVGCAAEIAALTLLTAVWLRWRHRGADAAPSWPALLGFFGITVATHPFMDWQGSYGWRPFLPWSDRWYYGDFVAIVDPVFWIVPLVALAWGAQRHWRSALGFAVILIPTSLLVLRSDAGAGWLKTVWVLLAGVAVVGWTPHWFGVAGRRRAAAWALGLIAGYALAQGVASLPAKAAVRRAAVARFGPDARWAALTVVGRPFTWTRIVASPDTVAGTGWAVPRHLDAPAVRRAVSGTRDGRAIARFARFLVARVDTTAGQAEVQLFDARYARRGRGGWASVVVPGD